MEVRLRRTYRWPDDSVDKCGDGLEVSALRGLSGEF